MNCLDPQKLSAYHDGALSADEARAVSDHLDTCPVCRHKSESIRDEIDQVAALFATRRELTIPQMPTSKMDRPQTRVNRWAPLATAASFFLIILALYLILSPGPQPKEETPARESLEMVNTRDLRLYDLSVRGTRAEPYLHEDDQRQTTFVWAAGDNNPS